MASLEQRKGAFRVIFRFEGKKLRFNLGNVTRADAESYRTTAEEILKLLERGVVSVPEHSTIEEFLLHRGKPPEAAVVVATRSQHFTLSELRTAYFKAQEKRLERTTLDGISQHFNHLERILSPKAVLTRLTRADLQRYLDTRSGEWIDPDRYAKLRKKKDKQKKSRHPKARDDSKQPREKRHPSPATIKKEIISLRTAWNWARHNLGLEPEFPGTALEFAKIEESLPYMMMTEAKWRIDAGENPDRVWECLYLRAEEVAVVLAHIASRPVSLWVHPMVMMAAHTGMRRSEIVRILAADVDFNTNTITVREKKRDHKKVTTRQVPLSESLKAVLLAFSAKRGNGTTFFCKANGKSITPREAHNYLQRALKGSEWAILRGYHIFRHSFISALASKGVDQRIIDDLVGHQTEEQRRRYRHLYPNVKQEAISSIF